ncbi:MAG: hypothetical protein ABJ364_08185 [Lentilitoribacter sp.]
MNMNKISKTTSPFPNIKSDMLDRLSKEADGRTEKAKAAARRSSRKPANSASKKAVWFRAFFRGKTAAETRFNQAPLLQARWV